ncbi:putative NAD(P)-binding domain superfamily [Arabidopsis thaliana]
MLYFSLADRKKTEHLLALDGAKERLKLFKADLLEESSFEQAIEGCDAVFHTASPVFFTVKDPQVFQQLQICCGESNAC